jgi:hypothetical protein
MLILGIVLFKRRYVLPKLTMYVVFSTFWLTLQVVGHSLGGGTAALLTYILRERLPYGSTNCVCFAPGMESPVSLRCKVLFLLFSYLNYKAVETVQRWCKSVSFEITVIRVFFLNLVSCECSGMYDMGIGRIGGLFCDHSYQWLRSRAKLLCCIP